jgi:hypothetical protein
VPGDVKLSSDSYNAKREGKFREIGDSGRSQPRHRRDQDLLQPDIARRLPTADRGATLSYANRKGTMELNLVFSLKPASAETIQQKPVCGRMYAEMKRF